MTRAIPYIIPFLILSAMTAGLFPQSAGDPFMMAPFFIIASTLISSGCIFKIKKDDFILLPLMGMWLAWLLSGIYSDVPFPSKVTWVITSTLPAAYLLAKSTDKNPLSLLPIICLPFAIYSIWEWINGLQRPDTPFDDANLLGLLYVFGILSGLPQTHADKQKNIRILFGISLTILFIAIIITQSRSALLCLICGGIFYATIKYPISTYLNKKMLIKIAAAIPLFLLLVYATGFINRFNISTGRLTIWQGAWEMVSEHPFLGFGLGTFHLYYPPYRMGGDDSLGWMVHMDPLQTAIESGWLGVLILYSLFIIPFAFLYKNRKIINHIQMGSGAILVSFFVAMHLNYPLRVVPFLIILAMALASLNFKTPKEKIPLMASCGILLTLLSAVWVMTQTSITLLLAKETDKAYHLHDQSRFDTAIAACINNGDKDFPDCKLMAARFLTLAHDPDQTKINWLLNGAEKANPTSPEPDYLRAQNLLLQSSGNMDKALELLKHSLSLNPAYWPSRRLAIEILIKKGDRPAAQTLLDKGLIYPYATQTRDDISRIIKTLDGHQ